MTLIHAAYLLLPAVAMGASAVNVSTPVVQSGTPAYSAPLTFMARATPAAGGSAAVTGTITFPINNVVGAPQIMDATGAATVRTMLGAGSHSISARYNGDSNYSAASSGSLSLTVEKAVSSVAMSSNPAQLNQPVAIRAAPTLASPATAAAIGTVDFTSSGTPITGCTGVPIQNGAAICTSSFTKTGTVQVNAAYSGDINIQSSTGTLALTVGKVVAGTYLAVTPQAPVYGTTVTISALLMGAAGVAAPTGGISFVVGTGTLPPMPVGTDGRATLVIPSGAFGPLSAGPYQLAAIYTGDDNYQSSRSTDLTLTVAKATPTVTLSATSSSGQTTLMAAVALTGGVAGGTVTMSIGGAAICSGVALQNGAATCPLNATPGASYTVAANYSGDANTNTATGSLQFTAGKSDPSITTSYAPTAPAYGAPVTLTATVAGVSGQAGPTGTVAFTDGQAGLGVAPVGGDGKASVASMLSVGTHNIVAIYSGDNKYSAVTASAMSVVVAKGATSLSLTATPAQTGQISMLKATVVVTGSGGVAGGTVSMTDGNSAICTAVALQSGSATCPLTIQQTGTYSISASYTGDANTAPSTGSLQFTVSKAAAGVSTSYTPAAPVYGVPVTITALAVGASSQAAPGGTITFSDGSTALGSASLGTDGRAAVTQTLSVGTHSIVSAYGGDATYQGVSAGAVSIVVGKASTSLLSG